MKAPKSANKKEGMSPPKREDQDRASSHSKAGDKKSAKRSPAKEKRGGGAREKTEHQIVLESIGEGIIIIRPDLRVDFMNAYAAKTLGISPKRAVGRSISATMPVWNKKGEELSPSRNPILRAMETLERSETPPDTFHYMENKKTGEKIPVHITATPIIKNGELVGAVSAFRDMTREHDIDRAKTEFVSLASHQLRTPLSIIGMNLELMQQEGLETIHPEQLKNHVQDIEYASRRMMSLIKTLLDISRIELGTLDIQKSETEVEDVIDAELDHLEPQAKEKNIVVIKDIEPNLSPIYTDPKFIRIIIHNLLSNAIKYSKEGGEVTVSAKNISSSKIGRGIPAVRVAIQDKGYGIPKDQQNKVFTKLFRADNIRRNGTEGTGLGLYAAHSIMEQIGGKIWFLSKEGKGSTFYIDLPIGDE